MKKNYFMLAAATMMFAACAETDLVNEVNMEEAPKAIGFDAFANKTTREITSLTDLQAVGFQVWGYKYPSGATIVWENAFEGEGEDRVQTATKNAETIFDGVNATYSTTWGHDGTPQYWNDAYKYNFYAVAPQDPATGATYYINKGDIAITGVASAKSTASADYLIATPVTEKNGSDKGIVSFNFSHIMSKISLKLKAGVAENIVVTSLKMSGWNNATGIFTQNSNQEWTFTEGENNTSGEYDFVGSGTSNTTLALNKDMETLSLVTDTYIMVPQTIAANTLKFTITYKIIRGVADDSENRPANDLDDEVFTNQEGTLQTEQTWAKNTHTTYTITVSPAEIKFDIAANQRFDWGTGTGSTIIQ